MPIQYIPKKISELKTTNSKVSIVGKVVQISENEFVLQDETGKVKIFSEEKVEKDNIIRAFCSMVGGNLKLDVVQSLNGFDLNLYNKAKELYNRAGL